MRNSYFCNDVENHYDIENIDEITALISKTDLDIESAGEYLGMTQEQINTVRLIYAKEYYYQGFYEKRRSIFKVC